MIRIYHPYTLWEDYKNGMFNKSNDNNIDMVKKSIDLLCDETALYDAMKYVSENWKYSSEHNLTDLSQNRKSWLGQAACCFEHGASQGATCTAWWSISEKERERANNIANQVIKEWELENSGDIECLKLDLE